MDRFCSVAVLAALAGAPVAAQETRIDARITSAIAVLDESGPGQGVSGEPLLDAQLVVQRRDVLASGLELVWRGELRIERDAPGRTAFAGALAACPVGLPGCTGGGGLPPRSPATGLASLGVVEGEEDAFVALEGASLSLAGSWGEGVVGLDSGVAARLDARAPQVLEAVSAFSPTLDGTGRTVTRARNDVTGPSFKASYMSPRWLGVRAGVSFTPEADLRGADFDPRPEALGVAAAELESVVEGALSFDRRFRGPDLRLRAALTATRASSGSAAAFGDYEAWGAGVEVEKGGWTTGLRWLSSNNARNSGLRYEAAEFGVARETGPWRFGLEAGWSRDRLTQTEGWSWLAGLRRNFGERFAAGLAWVDSDVDVSAASRPFSAQGRGLVAEFSVRK